MFTHFNCSAWQQQQQKPQNEQEQGKETRQLPRQQRSTTGNAPKIGYYTLAQSI